MNCPTLKDLPPPPPGKTGWPWVEESPLLAEHMLDGSPWPKISIVTPSYNQGQFIEETIRSVLLQGYPNLEYIVIDGGSEDNSVDIIKKYESFISYWISEKDRGQSHAINKGLMMATGSIIGWINSDDFYWPGALKALARCAIKNPGKSIWIGNVWTVNKISEKQHIIERRISRSLEDIAHWWPRFWFHQPGCLFSSDAQRRVGLLDERLHYTMDVDYWIRLSRVAEFAFIDDVVAAARLHPDIKTLKDETMSEAEHAYLAIKNDLPQVAKNRLLDYMARYLSNYQIQFKDPSKDPLLKNISYQQFFSYFLKRTVDGFKSRLKKII